MPPPPNKEFYDLTMDESDEIDRRSVTPAENSRAQLIDLTTEGDDAPTGALSVQAAQEAGRTSETPLAKRLLRSRSARHAAGYYHSSASDAVLEDVHQPQDQHIPHG